MNDAAGEILEDDGIPDLLDEPVQSEKHLSEEIDEEESVPVEEEEVVEEEKEEYEFTNEQVAVFKQAFSLYDKVKNNTIPILSLGNVLRSISLNPTEAQLSSYVKWLDADLRSGVVKFKEFLIIVGRTLKNPITELEALEGFRDLDEAGTGVLTREQLKDVLTMTGEKLYENEFAKFMKTADPKKGLLVKYEEFLEVMSRPKGSVPKKKNKKKRKGSKKRKKRTDDESSSDSNRGNSEH